MSKVAVLKTKPDTVLDDYYRLLHLVSYEDILPKDVKTIIKLNLSWTLFYPSCSTPPWQLDGVLGALRKDGYKDILAVENKTVVTKPLQGAINNKWNPVLKKHDVKFQPLPDVKWIEYKPKRDLSVLDSKVFDCVILPEFFKDTNVIHLPTQKTHGHSVMTRRDEECVWWVTEGSKTPLS